MVFEGQNDLVIRIRVDDSGTAQLIDEIGREIAEVDQVASKASVDGFSKFQASLVSLNQGIELARTAFGLAQTAFQGLSEALDRAGEVEGLTSAFANLQSSVGALAEDSIQSLREATGGLISDFDLMQTANQAVLLGVDQGTGEFDELSASAIKLGRAMGVDAKDAVDSLVVGIGRQSRQVLDNLGVIVDSEVAYERYAVRLGKTTEALTDQERKLAFNDAAFKAINEKAAQLTDTQETAAIAAERVAAQFTNLTDRFFTAISANSDLTDALNLLAEALAALPVEAVIEALAKLVSFITSEVVRVFDDVTKAATEFQLGLEVLSAFIDEVASGNLNAYSDALDTVAERMAETQKAEEKLVEITQGFKKQVEGVSEVIQRSQRDLERNTGATDTHTRATDKSSKAAKEAQRELEKLADQQNRYADEIRKAITGSDDFRDALNRMISSGIEDADDATRAFADLLANKLPLVETARTLEQELTQAYRDFAIEVSEGNVSIAEAAEQIAVLEGQLGTLKEQINDGLSIDGGGFFDDLIGGLFGTGTGDPNSLGGLFGGIFGDLFTQLTDEAISGNNDNNNEEVGQQVGAVIGAAIAAYFSGGTLTALGAGIGGALGGLIGGLFESDAQQAIREEVDRYFADIFQVDPIVAVINGQLERIFDLTFNDFDFKGGTFDDFFETLPLVAQQSFNGVGAAFTGLLGTGREVGAQLGAIFANNLGGDLNALQLLVQSTGKTFEELGEGVTEAFLDGTISALEAQTALIGLQNIAEEGIPGALGAVDKAFQNLKDAGTQGGRALIDALKDVGAEAQELGIRDLAGVQRHLEETGKFSAEEIQQVMNALQSNGIDSVEALTNATTGQLLPVLAELEAQEFPFTKATEEMQELIDKVNELPARVESTVQFNVRTNFDSNTQEALDKGLLPNGARGLGERPGQ